MRLNDILENAGTLPVTDAGLGAVLEELADYVEVEDGNEHADGARYAIRALAALLPWNRFTLQDVVEAAGIRPDTEWEVIRDILTGTGPYEGECSATVLRMLLGLVDDGVSPTQAGEHLGIDADELGLLNAFLDLNGLWKRRAIDRAAVVVFEGGGIRAIAKQLGVSYGWAWWLWRQVRREAGG